MYEHCLLHGHVHPPLNVFWLPLPLAGDLMTKQASLAKAQNDLAAKDDDLSRTREEVDRLAQEVSMHADGSFIASATFWRQLCSCSLIPLGPHALELRLG